jgi:hypothetical protein
MPITCYSFHAEDWTALAPVGCPYRKFGGEELLLLRFGETSVGTRPWLDIVYGFNAKESARPRAASDTEREYHQERSHTSQKGFAG